MVISSWCFRKVFPKKLFKSNTQSKTPRQFKLVVSKLVCNQVVHGSNTPEERVYGEKERFVAAHMETTERHFEPIQALLRRKGVSAPLNQKKRKIYSGPNALVKQWPHLRSVAMPKPGPLCQTTLMLSSLSTLTCKSKYFTVPPK